MPILMDFSQISRASIAQALAEDRSIPVEENLIRHFVMNSVRSNYMKFKQQYGNMIICADHRTWRRDYFEFYKGRRRKDREKDENWDLINRVIQETLEILKTSSTFRVVHVPGAEADDVIAWFCNRYGTDSSGDEFGGIGSTVEDILVLSGDKDFQQLQVYKNVHQYSPSLKKFIRCQDPETQRKELILRGDVGDGVPNVLSEDDILMKDGTRQRPVTSKFLASAIEAWPEVDKVQSKVGATVLARNFARNYKLIDLLESTPEDVQKNIEEEAKKPPQGSLELLRQAFIAKRMKNMLDHIGDFRAVK